MASESQRTTAEVPPPPETIEIQPEAEGLLLGADSDIDPLLSIVMPTMNEEVAIGECIRRATEAISDLGVTAEIVISDSSTDLTPHIASEMGAIVVQPDEGGYGAAYRQAFEHVRGEFIVMGDADCTYDFSAIPDLLEPIANGEADLVMGSRFAGKIERGAMPALHRYVGNPLLTRFLNLFYSANVTDAHSGYRVFDRDTLATLDLRSDGMEFASEMIMDAASKGLTIREVPITYSHRKGDATLASFRDGWRHVRFMLLNAPGYLFSIPGGLIGGLGFVVMMLSLSDVSLAGVSFRIHTMIAGSLLTITGYQVASLGVFSTVVGDPIRKPSDRITQWLLEHATLERGATAGLILFTIGAVAATYLIISWLQSGTTVAPLVTWDIAAFTAIVLGIQLVFGSFFFSAAANGRSE